jgi:hypothetical protein
VGVRPEEVEDRRGRRRQSAEDEGRNHTEVAATGATQRPEQLLVLVLVALDDATVRQNYLRSEQVI